MERTDNCPSCHRGTFPEDAFCSACGTRIQARDEKTGASRRTLAHQTIATSDRLGCGSCGSPILPGDVFCSTCGERYGSAPEPRALAEMWVSILRQLEESTRGKYEFIRELGRGGMGTVYLARELDLDRLVAIKVLAPTWLTDQAMVERFRREARTIASLRHPSIVNVHGVGMAGDLHYFAMDFLEGVALNKVLRAKGSLPFRTVEAVLYQVGNALSYAHRPGRGVVHRDVKPANIILDTDGNAIVTDFGISKVTESSGLTMTGLIMGTPEYMSPEQCQGESISHPSDQYALGCVAFAMLTGAPPFTGPQYRVLMAHVSVPCPSILDVRPDCPPALADAVTRMLAKDPADRFPDIRDALKTMGLKPLSPDDPARLGLGKLVADTASIVAAGSGGARGQSPTQETRRTPTWLRILALPQGLETGDEIEMSATVLFNDGIEEQGAKVAWESTDPSIVRVDPATGQLVAVGAGRAVVTARVNGVTESVPVEVASARVIRLAIDPAGLDVYAGESALIAAEPQSRSGRRLDRPIVWSSSDPRIATISDTGEIRSHQEGEVSVLAHCDGVGASTVVRVHPARVTSVSIRNAPSALSPGESHALRAVPVGVDGRELDRWVEWSSSDESVLRINTGGQLVAVAVGKAEITVECEGLRAVHPIAVQPPPVERVSIDSPPDHLIVGDRAQLKASALDASGRTLERSISWKSSAPEVLSVSGDGSVDALGEGRVHVTAAAEDKSAGAHITVRPVPVHRVAVRNLPGGLLPGDEFTLTAAAEDRNGGTLERAIEWSVSDSAVIRTLGEGCFRAEAAGTATVSAVAGGVVGAVELVVDGLVVASVRLVAPGDTVDVDQSITIGAVLEDQRGRAIERPIRWSSSNPDVARVSSDGVVTARKAGRVRIRAVADGAEGRLQLVVPAPPEPAPALERRETVPVPEPELSRGAAASGSEKAVVGSRAGADETASDSGGPSATSILFAGLDESTPGDDTPVDRAVPETAITAVEEPQGRRRLLWIAPAGVAVAALVWAGVQAMSGGSGPVDPVVVDPPIGEDAGGIPVATVTAVDIVTADGDPIGNDVTLSVGDSLPLGAGLLGSGGESLNDRTVDWSSLTQTVASVTPDGVVVAHGGGATEIRAEADGVSSTITVRVSAPQVANAGSGAGQVTAPPPDPVGDTEPVTQTGDSEAEGDPPPTESREAAPVETPADETQPTEDLPDGLFRLVVVPWAYVTIDGERVGEDTRRLEVSLWPGTHTLRLENPNMQTVDTTFVIQSGETNTLSKQMSPGTHQ